MYSILYFIISF